MCLTMKDPATIWFEMVELPVTDDLVSPLLATPRTYPPGRNFEGCDVLEES